MVTLKIQIYLFIFGLWLINLCNYWAFPNETKTGTKLNALCVNTYKIMFNYRLSKMFKNADNMNFQIKMKILSAKI